MSASAQPQAVEGERNRVEAATDRISLAATGRGLHVCRRQDEVSGSLREALALAADDAAKAEVARLIAPFDDIFAELARQAPGSACPMPGPGQISWPQTNFREQIPRGGGGALPGTWKSRPTNLSCCSGGRTPTESWASGPRQLTTMTRSSSGKPIRANAAGRVPPSEAQLCRPIGRRSRGLQPGDDPVPHVGEHARRLCRPTARRATGMCQGGRHTTVWTARQCRPRCLLVAVAGSLLDRRAGTGHGPKSRAASREPQRRAGTGRPP